MKCGFIRTLWGRYDHQNELISKYRGRVDRDISKIIKNKYEPKFTVFVMGKDNFNYLSQMGLNCVLVNEEPYVWNNVKRNWLNKIECMKFAMEQSGYDEIVYLDWDCVAFRAIPDNFWDVLNQKESIQTALYRCPINILNFRKGSDNKKPSAGGFVYIRDKTIPSKLLKLENSGMSNKWLDEVYYASLIDEMSGGWKGERYYWEHFEPEWIKAEHSVFDKHPDLNKKPCFVHPAKGKRHET